MNEILNQEKKRYIHIMKEDREFIMKSLGVTERTVLNAIRFDEKRGNSDTAKRIRKLAMSRGGIVMVVNPEIETLFDADNYMRQYFPNGALIELDKKAGTGDVLFKGERAGHYENVSLRDIEEIQAFANALK
nr:MAG TPA: hypothetical protein [Caudoviricetes sp.]